MRFKPVFVDDAAAVMTLYFFVESLLRYAPLTSLSLTLPNKLDPLLRLNSLFPYYISVEFSTESA